MPTGRNKLSANMAALSHALELTQPAAAGFNINIRAPRRGVRDVRGMEPTAGRGADAEHLPILIRDREQTGEGRLKTFLRNATQYLGASTGIQTKRMREDYELLQAEAGEAYAEQQADQGRMAASLMEQIGADALRLESYGNAALDEHAANLRRDAAEAMWQFENLHDPEMRSGSLTQLQELQATANKELDSHVDAGLQEARTFAREELKDLRRSINEAQDQFTTRRADADAMRARLSLIGSGDIEEKGLEGQAILTEAFERMAHYQDTLGGALSGAGAIGGAIPNPYAQAAGAAVSIIGKALESEKGKLSYSDVLKAFEAQQSALDKFTLGDGKQSGYLQQLLEGLTQREQFARDRLGIPIDESWRASHFDFPAPQSLPAETAGELEERANEDERRATGDARSAAYATRPGFRRTR